jgi:hypothetical protein
VEPAKTARFIPLMTPSKDVLELSEECLLINDEFYLNFIF